ncbi:hypothetical protein IQ266_08470 [filamentous cyanobacterium LEGE 11480]|uniref:Ricin B lectin domain-containing protein n=1 Tax=Romeriopsis navalis LEGE 11480 TaxID=2777977 RepID=A0A928VPI7_9CYAN|nr:hypothetical protein [Romeriopsis navalis]MBE9029759.1 hypothetical protein [Romeriopsis navalis LEGE 11480]
MFRQIAAFSALALITAPAVALNSKIATATPVRQTMTLAARTQVNGRNVNFVRNAKKSYANRGNGNWVEMDSSNRVQFTFKEIKRDAWSVYLLDRSRNVQIQLDLNRKKIVFSNKTRRFDLGNITSASATVPGQTTPKPTRPTSRPTPAKTRFVPDAGFEYSIIESTKGERVSVGSDGNVSRWSNNGGKAQRWRFIAVEGDKNKAVHIQSMKNGDFLGVAWNGNMSVHQPNNDNEQKFRIWKLNATEAKKFAPAMYEKYKQQNVEFITIIESSKAERVAVGSNGNILRWGHNTEPSQMFVLKKERRSVNPFTTFENKGSINYKWTKAGTYKWNGGTRFTRVVRNPLDGGVLLRYKQTVEQSYSDGCSAPGNDSTTLAFKKIFLMPCLEHDTNYDAPFLRAFFQNQNQKALGQDVADYIFRKNMLKVADRVFAKEPIRMAHAKAVAEIWHTSVNTAPALGLSKGVRTRYNHRQTVLEKGGVILIRNRAPYTVSAQLEYTTARGHKVKASESAASGYSVVLPISAGARNITVKSWALAGAPIFSKTYSSPVSLGITTKGTSLSPSWSRIGK